MRRRDRYVRGGGLGSRKGRLSKSGGNSKLGSLGICIVAGGLYARNRGYGGLARVNGSIIEEE